jgi:hypothetical protein
VYLLFLDESGKIEDGGLFALGGLAIRDADWPELRERWPEVTAYPEVASARPLSISEPRET